MFAQEYLPSFDGGYLRHPMMESVSRDRAWKLVVGAVEFLGCAFGNILVYYSKFSLTEPKNQGWDRWIRNENGVMSIRTAPAGSLRRNSVVFLDIYKVEDVVRKLMHVQRSL